MANPISDKRPQAIIVEVLQLAPAAYREVSARRRCVVRAVDQSACRIKQIARSRERYITAVGGNAVAARSDADNLIGFIHRSPMPVAGRAINR